MIVCSLQSRPYKAKAAASTRLKDEHNWQITGIVVSLNATRWYNVIVFFVHVRAVDTVWRISHNVSPQHFGEMLEASGGFEGAGQSRWTLRQWWPGHYLRQYTCIDYTNEDLLDAGHALRRSNTDKLWRKATLWSPRHQFIAITERWIVAAS